MAVVAGILNVPVKKSYDPTQTLSQRDFDTMLAHEYISSERGRSWFPAERDGNVRYAYVDTRDHYLRVAIHMDPGVLRIEIVESKNLLQEDGRIHKKVPEWIDNLATHIQRELFRLAAYGTAGRPPG
ncbi:MAG TPA: hypothetical protein VMR31_04270 [Myxococcota bacterium]|nr:hypothetical protein [Myxococcota bacterium]